MACFLELKNIFKYYGSFAANKDINLSVKEGTIHAIVGENGAGKSTLMNILAGVIPPSFGEIILRGNTIKLKNPNDATKHKIGMVQQEFMLFEDLSVIENIVMGHEDVKTLNFLDFKKSKQKVIDICQRYHFNFPLDQKVGNLPIAIQQQVEIVKVLYKDADIIILDEPTAVLTPQGIEGLFEAMRFLVANGKTLIFITHKLKEVLHISDRITVLKNGSVVAHMDTQETNERKLAEAMIGREVFLDIDRKERASESIFYEVKGLCVLDDKRQQVVKNVSFNIHRGEVVGLVGIAGNGQTELIQSLFGIRKYQEGTITYNGRKMVGISPRECRLGKIGYVPQDRRGIGSSITSTIVENSMMGKHLTSFFHKGVINLSEAQEFTKKVVANYDVRTGSINNTADSLSGGNLQKLIVGREFSQDAQLLIVEDPTRGIDIGSMEFIWNEIVRMVETENHSCLLVSYDLSEAMALSDRILVLYQGEIVREFKRKDFDEQDIGFYMLGGNEGQGETYET